MISVQPFRLFTLLQLAGVSLLVTSTADTTSGRDCSAFTNIPHALTKRGFNPQRIKWHMPFVRGRGPRGFPGTVLKAEPSASKASRLPDRAMRVEEHPIHHLDLDTFALQKQKELHAGPSNVEILCQIIQRLTSGTKISASQGRAIEEEPGFESRLLEFVVNSFGEEENASRWDRIFNALQSLDTAFLREVQKAFDLKDPQRTPQTPQSLREAIAKSIATVHPELSLPDGKINAEALYEIIDKISPGIWRLSLPTKDGRFNLDFLKSNPIAHMSWVLEDLDPEEMISYAEAFQIPEKPTVHQLMHRQLILEQPDKTEPRQKFAGPSWFVQRVGWGEFQDIMLYFEKSQHDNSRLKLKDSRYSLKLGKFVKDNGTRQLNSLLVKMGLPVIDERNHFSNDMMAWLSSLCVLEFTK